MAVRVPGFLPEDRYDLQPLRSQDGRTLFVCQARLDNRAELLSALAMHDQPPAEIADSTILFAAYQRWGEQTPARLMGDYAFAAYSTETKTLFAAVDHLAHYRLYYAARGDRIVLCTQLPALRCLEENASDLDEVALGLSAEARYVPGGTPFRNIRQLSGGESLRWNDGGAVEVRRWWQPASRATRYKDPAEYIEAVREVFESAVLDCLRSATPVSATLSGGLDSGLVAALAARILGDRGGSLKAYTSAPATERPVFLRPGWDVDDAPFAAEIAAFHPNIEHVVLRSDERAAIDLMPEIHHRCATPVRNGANHLWMDSIARSAGPGVLLVGVRGNFSLSYSGAGSIAELLRSWQWRAALQCASATQQTEGRPAWRALAGGLQPLALRDLRRRMFGEKMEHLSLTTQAFRKQHRDVLHPKRPRAGTRADLVRSMTLSNYVWAADPLAMWGVEWRDPTADRRLLELLLSFPLAAFTHDGRQRGMARELGRGLIPEPIRLRQTRGGQSMDYAAAMTHRLTRYQEAHDRMAASAECRALFDLHKLHNSLGRVRAGETSGALTSPIDRCVDAGLFLLEQRP